MHEEEKAKTGDGGSGGFDFCSVCFDERCCWGSNRGATIGAGQTVIKGLFVRRIISTVPL